MIGDMGKSKHTSIQCIACIKYKDCPYEDGDCPAVEYARSVLDGKDKDGKEIITCKWVKLACGRFVDDLKNGKKRGLEFDIGAANNIIFFYQWCPHFKGEWAGSPVELELWQAFIVSNLFGWKYKDTGFRRFKVAYITVARKNGKTTMIAPVGLYLLSADGEPGAEIYSAAVDRDQAREIFDAAKTMVQTGELQNHITTLVRNMYVEKTRSKFEPLSADEKKQHGKNIHAALCDELHVWPKHSLWAVLRTGMGSRRQPVQIAITTAGTDQASICYQVHDLAKRVLTGFKGQMFVDDAFFGIIYTLDTKTDWPALKTKAEYNQESVGIQEDDWMDESVWIKANPNLGISVKLKDMRDEARTAKQMPTSLNSFLNLRMNIWVQQVNRWIDLELWDSNHTSDVYIMEG